MQINYQSASTFPSINKNEIFLGIHQRKMLEFANKYLKTNWSSFSPDQRTKRVLFSLVKKKLLKINEFNQFKLV